MTVEHILTCNVCDIEGGPVRGLPLCPDAEDGEWEFEKDVLKADKHICERCGNGIARLFSQPDPRLEALQKENAEARALLRTWVELTNCLPGSRADNRWQFAKTTQAFLAKPEANHDG